MEHRYTERVNERLTRILDAERRIELIRGRVQIAGSRAMTRLVLQQLLVQTTLAELRDLGGERWRGAAQLAPQLPLGHIGTFNHRRHYSLLQRVSLPLFELLSGSALTTHARDIAVRLGDSVLTPDVFIGSTSAMREYYLEGSPLLAIEIIDPYNPAEELERLGLYFEYGTPEVWWFEPAHALVRQFVLQGGDYAVSTYHDGWLESAAVEGLAVDSEGAWQPGWRPPLTIRYSGKSNTRPEPQIPNIPPHQTVELTDLEMETLLGEVLGTFDVPEGEPVRRGYHADLPFAPHVGLAPQQVSFEAFISWTTEAKFEVVDDQLVVGSPRGTRELLGLLLQSLGLIDAFSLLDADTKAVLGGAN